MCTTLLQVIAILLVMIRVGGEVIRIETSTQFQYRYLNDYGLSISTMNHIVFSVRATNDAHIALSKYIKDWDIDSYEIVLGGWSNQKSVIRKCDQCLPKVTHDEAVLNGSEFRTFWIAWPGDYRGTNLSLGKGSVVYRHTILHWHDPDSHTINYVGVSTGWGANGTWLFNLVDGGWSSWQPWSECSTSCGGGQRSRMRSCDNPEPMYGRPCEGEYEDIDTECSSTPCPIDGAWSAWAPWSPCSSSCGQGQSVTTRSCDNPYPQNGGKACEGSPQDTEYCDRGLCPVPGGWGSWGSWSKCSMSCGTGHMTRYRSCDQPKPQNSGPDCEGQSQEQIDCMVDNCPVAGGWSTWGEWDTCTTSCGGGRQYRTRLCDSPTPEYDGDPCVGDKREGRTCNPAHCPVNGGWSSWSEWGECSVSCGTGVSARRRHCDAPLPQYDGMPCAEHDLEEKDCSAILCPVDGEWSSWSPWSACTVTCGHGNTTRNRSCDNPAPLRGGLDCEGNDTEFEQCTEIPCPVPGEWSEWTVWSRCDPSCGQAHTNRHRVCDNPPPAHGGANCSGHKSEILECPLVPCPINGSWSEWGDWGSCSVSCGPGSRSRMRNCTQPPPQHGGFTCPGNRTRNSSCNEALCPVDGSWSAWSYWSECDKTCGTGHMKRRRTCTNPQPMHGGKHCDGNNTKTMICNTDNCPEKATPKPEDSTTEAQGALTIGIIGLGLCCAILGAVVILDLATIHRHFAFMKANVGLWLYRHGWKKHPPGKTGSRRSHQQQDSVKESHYDPEPGDTAGHEEPSDLSQVEIRLEAPPPPLFPARTTDNPLLSSTSSQHLKPDSNIQNNFNTVDRKELDVKYHKALNGYANIELSQTQL